MSASSPQTKNSTDEDQCAQERRLKPLRCSRSRSRCSRSRSRSRRSRSSFRPSRSSLRPKEASCHSIDFQCCPAWTCQTLITLSACPLVASVLNSLDEQCQPASSKSPQAASSHRSASSSASGHAAAPQESNQKARIVSFAPDTDLPDHDCGELSAFFKQRAKERGEMK